MKAKFQRQNKQQGKTSPDTNPDLQADKHAFCKIVHFVHKAETQVVLCKTPKMGTLHTEPPPQIFLKHRELKSVRSYKAEVKICPISD